MMCSFSVEEVGEDGGDRLCEVDTLLVHAPRQSAENGNGDQRQKLDEAWRRVDALAFIERDGHDYS